MISREEILRTPEYWFEYAQDELYRQVVEYLEKENLNQSQLAARLGVSKGYISQVLKGEFNYTLKKLIELSLAVGKVPQIEYKALQQVIDEDKKTVYLHQVSNPVTPSLQLYTINEEELGEKKKQQYA